MKSCYDIKPYILKFSGNDKILIYITFALLIIGNVGKNLNFSFAALIMMFIINIRYCKDDLRNKLIFLIFNLTIFMFLISRPLIQVLNGTGWIYTYAYANKAIFLIYVSLVSIYVGARFAYNKINCRNVKEKKYDTEFLKSFIRVSSVLLFICLICRIYTEVDKLIFMRGRDYSDYYLLYKSSVPSVISAFSTMLEIAMCIFLATNPKKRITIRVLCLYVITSVPMLVIGNRGRFVSCLLFALIYFGIRESNDKNHWIGKLEKRILVVLIPIGVVLMGALNYIRDGLSIASFNIFSLFIDFLYKQGVSFDVLTIGIKYQHALPNIAGKNYTFGCFIDYLKYNTISQKIFGTIDIGSTNSVLKAVESNDLSHALSYVSHPGYLQGHGWGSSYILETYFDFNIIGLIIFSLIIGFFTIYLMRLTKRGILIYSIILIGLTNFFLIPRAKAMGWLEFLVKPHFIVAELFCFVAAFIIVKIKRNLRRNEGRDKMKIGILSMQRVVNYGSFLQAYGLKSIVESIEDCKVEFIDVKRTTEMSVKEQLVEVAPWLTEINRLIGKIKKNNLYLYKRKKDDLFRNQLYGQLGMERELSYKEDYDKVIIGSDEVFNCTQEDSEWFLSMQLFGEGYHCDVLSYAASFGYTTMERLRNYKVDKLVKKNLKSLESISVRDKNSYSIVKDLTGIEPEEHLDPVLIYDYEKEMKYEVKEENYILIYAYDGRIKDDNVINSIREFAKKNNLNTISIGGYQEWCNLNLVVHPFELLEYVKKASYVVTDTFHGTIYSIKFNKQFATIVKEKNKQKLTDLLAKFKLQDRIVDDYEQLQEKLLMNSDFKYVNEKIAIERARTREYLEKNLR